LCRGALSLSASQPRASPCVPLVRAGPLCASLASLALSSFYIDIHAIFVSSICDGVHVGVAWRAGSSQSSASSERVLKKEEEEEEDEDDEEEVVASSDGRGRPAWLAAAAASGFVAAVAASSRITIS